MSQSKVIPASPMTTAAALPLTSEAPMAPREASTLIILALSPTHDEPMVAMLRRSSQSRFMPGALVFPGGGVEEVDARAAIDHALDYATTQNFDAWGFTSELEARRSCHAALRETEEESGLTYAQLIEGESVLRCVGRWLTPESLKRRFDTYFWMITLDAPAGLPTLSVDGVEIERGLWIEPSRALTEYERGALDLPAPTLCVLGELAELSAALRTPAELHALTERLSAHAHSTPICPVLKRDEDQTRLYLPGDPLYFERRGDAPRVQTSPFWSVSAHHLERVTLDPESAPTYSKIWRRHAES